MQLRNSRRNRRNENVLSDPVQQVWERLCSRMGNLGTYRLMQINGQRKFFDPLDDSPPMVDGCEVFVGSIPRNMFEDELVPLFAHYGPIHELRLMMNFSGTNRGFAFVMYKDPTYAEQAIRRLNNFEVRHGEFIAVLPSVNNRRLYIGRLNPSSTNEATLLRLLSNLTEGLQSLSVHVMKRVHDKPNRKYAIAVYVSHRHAAMARRFLFLRKDENFHQDVIVDWAWPIGAGAKHNAYYRPSVGDEASKKHKTLSTVSPATAKSLTRNSPQPADAAAPSQKPTSSSPKTSAPSADSRKQEKVFRILKRPPGYQRNEKNVNANKGFCYNRLAPPLYTLSPVPKPYSMLYLLPPPADNDSESKGNAKNFYGSDAAAKDKPCKEDKQKINNKPQKSHGLSPRTVDCLPQHKRIISRVHF